MSSTVLWLCWAAGLSLVASAPRVVTVDVEQHDNSDDDVVPLAFSSDLADHLTTTIDSGNQNLVQLSQNRTRSALSSAKCPVFQSRLCGGHGLCRFGICKCDDGWTNLDCSVELCANNCSGHGVCDNGMCVCDKGWTRSDCSTDTCPNQCSGRGTCVSGECECHMGWLPPLCDVDSCPNHCSGNGNCSLGYCLCELGWKGSACDTDTCPNHCSGHGECVKGKCVCEDKWLGDDCSLSPCEKQCSGHGQCNTIIEECDCDQGWRGDACDKPVCLNDCFAALFQGVCVWSSERGFPPRTKCKCNQGFTGEDCSISTCPNACSNRGTCFKGECICSGPPFTRDCSVPLYDTCVNNCSAHGICTKLTNDENELPKCVCDQGWRGEDCRLDTCPHSCRGRGYCVMGQCSCFPQYSGPDCSEDSCPNRCSGHGTCDGVANSAGGDKIQNQTQLRILEQTVTIPGAPVTAGVKQGCTCVDGWSGAACNQSLCGGHLECSGHGQCEIYNADEDGSLKGLCLCWYGWSGVNCEEEHCPKLNDCSDHGRCEKGICVCDVGWSGESCDVDSCPRHCSGNGICVEGACECLAGWAGDGCQIRTYDQDLSEDNNYNLPFMPHPPTPSLVDGIAPREHSVEGVELYNEIQDNYLTASLRHCPNYCGGNGQCVVGKCVCDRGWAGADCTTPLCPPFPSSGIDLSSFGYVPHGYSQMEYFPCSGNGDCVTGQCACFLGFSGEDCSIVSPRGYTGPAPDFDRKMNTNVDLVKTRRLASGYLPPDATVNNSSDSRNATQPFGNFTSGNVTRS